MTTNTLDPRCGPVISGGQMVAVARYVERCLADNPGIAAGRDRERLVQQALYLCLVRAAGVPA
jgi:hypothetical protein